MIRALDPYGNILRRALAQPRRLTPESVQFLVLRHPASPEPMPPFLARRLPSLDGIEINTILTPLFTPSLRDCALFSDLLERHPLTVSEAGLLPLQLMDSNPRGCIITPEGQEVSVGLPLSCVTHHVRLLRLEIQLTETVRGKIDAYVPSPHRALVKAVVRCALPSQRETVELFLGYLHALNDLGRFSVELILLFASISQREERCNIKTLYSLFEHGTAFHPPALVQVGFAGRLPERVPVASEFPLPAANLVDAMSEAIRYVDASLRADIPLNAGILSRL